MSGVNGTITKINAIFYCEITESLLKDLDSPLERSTICWYCFGHNRLFCNAGIIRLNHKVVR